MLLREPIGRQAITGVRDAVDLGLFLAMAIVVGWLVDRLRTTKAQAVQSADRERTAREDLDRLVATITHDLATPLGAIQGTIQFARKHSGLSDVDGARLLTRVETAAARATSLVRALADAKSIEQQTLSLEMRPLDLRAVVEPLVKMLDRVSETHPIALAMDAQPLLVNGDADRLGRVIENLITNAIKYSPGGGAIEVYMHRHGEAVVLTVRDHGIGVSDEIRDRLFEMGFRAPQAIRVAPGLGLGLYTAAEVIRRHGGSIAAAPAEGMGTVFTVRLPLVHVTAADSDDQGMPALSFDSPSRAVH